MLWSHQRKSLHAHDCKLKLQMFLYIILSSIFIQATILLFLKIWFTLSCKFQYACIVGFVLILQIVAGILAVVFRDEVYTSL